MRLELRSEESGSAGECECEGSGAGAEEGSAQEGAALHASDGFNGSLPFLTWYRYLDSFDYQRSRYVKYGYSLCAMIVSLV